MSVNKDDFDSEMIRNLPTRCISLYTYAIGQNIKKYRLEMGLTQPELATLMGICYTTERDHETGTRNITIRSIEDYANRLNVTVPQIMDLSLAYKQLAELKEKTAYDNG